MEDGGQDSKTDSLGSTTLHSSLEFLSSLFKVDFLDNAITVDLTDYDIDRAIRMHEGQLQH